MDDDFNTALALGEVFDAVRELNRIIKYASQRPSSLYKEILHKACHKIVDSTKFLGILRNSPRGYIEKRNLDALMASGLDLDSLNDMIRRRDEARKARDWDTADRIRQELSDKGISLKDTPQGTIWSADL